MFLEILQTSGKSRHSHGSRRKFGILRVPISSIWTFANMESSDIHKNRERDPLTMINPLSRKSIFLYYFFILSGRDRLLKMIHV